VLLAAAIALVTAFPTTLVGAHAGAATAPIESASLGLGGGIAVDLSIQRQLAVEVAADVSEHSLARHTALLFAAGAGLQYRIDLAPVTPYATASVRYLWLSLGGSDLEGALGIGVLIPFGERWFCGVEATYGYGLVSGAFPLSSAFTFRFGWRSGEL
jgi:hypothetical protein